jgi:predicted permease
MKSLTVSIASIVIQRFFFLIYSLIFFFLFHWSQVTDHWSLPRSGLFHVRLITVISGLALSLTGVKVVPIPRLT